MRLVRFFTFFAFTILPVLPSCEQTRSAGTFTGRRWYVESRGTSCRFWGYLKNPEQSWSRGRLVILDERAGISPPDRPAIPPGPPFNGDDHNFEYHVTGAFTGQKAYDPNSDLELPVFAARSFQLLNRTPGDLPGVGSPFRNDYVPSRDYQRRLSR